MSNISLALGVGSLSRQRPYHTPLSFGLQNCPPYCLIRRILFERAGKPEVVNRPYVLHVGSTGAVIACNHVGWADSLWMGYAVYPRQLRYLSKQELFGSTLSRWVLEHGGCVPIDRADPSPSSIKTAVGILQQGELILVFPSGTREETIALDAIARAKDE